MQTKMNDLLKSDVSKIEIGLIDEVGNELPPLVVMDQEDVTLHGKVYIRTTKN